MNFSFTPRQALLGVFVLGIAAGFMGGIAAPLELDTTNTETVETDTPSQNENDNPSPSPSDNSDGVNMDQIELEGEPVQGQEDAPVTLVMYEDFECPFCQRFEQNAVPQIVSNYVESGDVKLVWKDYPLAQLHPWAEPAAAAMECVYREGGDEAFWAVKDRVFENQKSISTSNVETKIKQYASEEGVSKEAVQSCIDNDNPMEEVNQDKQEGSSLGVSGTPTVFVGGQKIVGAQPYSKFETAIESALN